MIKPLLKHKFCNVGEETALVKIVVSGFFSCGMADLRTIVKPLFKTEFNI